MRQFLRDNGLSVALFILFLISILGQAVAGWRALVEELRLHEQPPVGFVAYLTTGHFLSATFENWESECLQMSVYVLLTAVLVQKGSPGGDGISGRPGSPGRQPAPAQTGARVELRPARFVLAAVPSLVSYQFSAAC